MIKRLRRLFLAPLLFLSASAFAAPSEGLTSAQEAKFLDSADGICADTWCSGDYNFRFQKFSCSSTECSLDLSFWPRNDADDGESLPGDERQASCRLASSTREFTSEVYDAVTQCINEDILMKNPLAYVPMASRCAKALKQKPQFQMAAHSLFAEIFQEGLDPREAAAKTLIDLVERYAEGDAACQLERWAIYKDQILCEKPNGTGGPICVIPSDQGRFALIKDYVDSAAVIYIDSKKASGVIGAKTDVSWQGQLPAPESCYSDLLNQGGLFAPLKPTASGDHYSFYVSTRGLNSTENAIANGVEIVRRAVKSVSVKAKAKSCELSFAQVEISKDACFNLGGTDICVFQAAQAGYFVVTKDDDRGAYVSFVRYD